MTSIYGIRLYELLMQWQTTGRREVEIDWLKQQFELDESYARIDNFKARVIEPAVKDINSHSNYQMSWEQRKTGRRVTHFIFQYAEKNVVIPVSKKGRKKAANSVINAVSDSLAIDGKIDNIKFFTELYKRFGDTTAISEEYKQTLKDRGLW